VGPLDADRVADPGQHVGDGVSHHYVWGPFTNSPF
jgi:hypothetical protein